MRKSGILLPVFSLPSPYGIGTFGKEAYRFIDFLKAAGQSFWQLLPLHPTGYGDSPYQSFSSFAGNPYFIDPERLCEEGLLLPEELSGADSGGAPVRVDYGALYRRRFPLLKAAFRRFKQKPHAEFEAFCIREDAWLSDYALFMALKDAAGGAPWTEWETPLKFRDGAALEEAREKFRDEQRFYRFLQFQFFRQWQELKGYARAQGVSIIGDMPMYVAHDSADVWGSPEEFLLDENRTPTVVAGCPPDAFSEKGQLWGNPIYNWKYMGEQVPRYSWWRRRLAHALQLYDVVRIDHFRGFEAYYAIPYGAKDAMNGGWRPGPGMELFRCLQAELGELPIIAEDLGFLTPEVKRLLKDAGFPGMKVLQFAFDSREQNDYLPHNFERHAVVYIGTHDNDTLLGWEQHAAPEDVAFARRYLHVTAGETLSDCMIRAALASVADTCILMPQDFLRLPSEARINTPSTLGNNWCWRLTPGMLDEEAAHRLRELTALYGRLPEN